nr:leucine-rich repeat domain-containing protein [Parabacteroides leei]
MSLIELPSFENCLKMQSIVFPPNIKQVPSNLFIGCSSLQKVHMTESVSVIDEYAFKDSPSIDYVYLSSDKVPQVSENSFCSSVYQSARLFVPVNSLQFYKEDAVWGKFENIRTSGIATNYRVEMLLSEGGTVGIRQNEDDWEYYYYGYIERTESSRIEFHIRPKQDYIIESVVLNDKDITNTLDENNEFVIPYLMENTYLSVKFKKDDPTANEKIEVYKYVYRSAPGRLCLSGFEIGDSVYIFDAGGRLVTSKKISNNIEEVDLSTKGLYLIRSGKDLFKVIL